MGFVNKRVGRGKSNCQTSLAIISSGIVKGGTDVIGGKLTTNSQLSRPTSIFTHKNAPLGSCTTVNFLPNKISPAKSNDFDLRLNDGPGETSYRSGAITSSNMFPGTARGFVKNPQLRSSLQTAIELYPYGLNTLVPPAMSNDYNSGRSTSGTALPST